jgi:hypothetical protein
LTTLKGLSHPLSAARLRRQHQAFTRMQAISEQRATDGTTSSPPRSFDSLEELLQVLASEHVYGRYAYRGQTGRGESLGEDATIERLFPGDFRFFWRPQTHKQTPEQITAAREEGRNRRDRFFRFLQEKTDSGDSRLALLRPSFAKFQEQLFQPDYILSFALNERSLLDEPIFRVCWSLAQHYGLETGLLDLTHSIDVAAWFATNPWDPDRQPPFKGRGVIYRFDIDGLSYLFSRLNDQRRSESRSRGQTPPVRMFVVSIAHMSPTLASRPHAQRGLSLFGFDQLEAIQMAQFGGVLEVFTFPHAQPYLGSRANRAKIIPSTDPFLAVVRDYVATEEH